HSYSLLLTHPLNPLTHSLLFSLTLSLSLVLISIHQHSPNLAQDVRPCQGAQRSGPPTGRDNQKVDPQEAHQPSDSQDGRRQHVPRGGCTCSGSRSNRSNSLPDAE